MGVEMTRVQVIFWIIPPPFTKIVNIVSRFKWDLINLSLKISLLLVSLSILWYVQYLLMLCWCVVCSVVFVCAEFG